MTMNHDKSSEMKKKAMVGSTGAVGNGNTLGGRIFDVCNYIILTLVALTTIAPFIYIIGASFATELELAQRPLLIIPHDISFNAYEYIFSTNKIVSGVREDAHKCVNCGNCKNTCPSGNVEIRKTLY